MDDQPSQRDLPDPHDSTDEPGDATPGDPTWDVLASDLAGEGDAASGATARAWRGEHPDEAAAVDALDRTLDRLAFTPPADLDVEAALRRVKARRAEAPDAPDAPRVLPFRAPARPAVVTPVRRSRWTPMARAAAALLIVAGGVAGWQVVRGRRPDVAGRTFATVVGRRDSVLLSDGTRVTLGPRSTLEVASDYGRGPQREVRLHGEGYFAVEHDAQVPFVVHTDAASVRDVGTAFVVRDGVDGRVSVAVTEGSVLLHAAGADSAAGVLVPARGRGMLVPGRAPVVTPNAVTDDELAFTRGQLAFHDAPFLEVAAELRRWYGVELKAVDSSLVERHLTAVFHGEGPREVLRVVGLALGATVEERGDTAFVRVAPP